MVVVVGRVRLGGKEGGRGEGAGVGCVSLGGVCVWEGRGGRRKEGEGGEEATDSVEPQNSHKQSFFFLAWLVTFTELQKVLKCCLSFRHCHDCFNVLQNHTFRQYSFPCVSWWLPCPLELRPD